MEFLDFLPDSSLDAAFHLIIVNEEKTKSKLSF